MSRIIAGVALSGFAVWLLAPLAELGAADAVPLAAERDYAEYGRLLYAQMATAPFPHAKRAQGYTYKGQLYSAQSCYSDSTVALFVPKTFHATSKIDFVVHFHGWRGRLKNALSKYQLIEQFAASGRNAVLVVPQGPRDVPDSFGGKLEDPNGFERFMDEVLVVMKKAAMLPPGDASVGKIILSAHSGGGRVVGEILAVGGLSDHVSDVWLFDAMYSHVDQYMAWYGKQHGRLLDLYTDHGGTKDNSEKLLASLKQRGSKFVVLQDDRAKPTNLTPELSQRLPIFLHTDLAHDDVLQKRQTFRKFIETSTLDH